MSLLTHCGLVVGTVIGIGGVLLFSPYHTFFSISYFNSAQQILVGKIMDHPPSSDEESENVGPRATSSQLNRQENFLMSKPTTRHTVRPKEDKVVDYKSFMEMKNAVANLIVKMDHMKADLVTAQNKIAMLERSIAQTPKSNISGLLFTPKR